jgi:hypothetical protein
MSEADNLRARVFDLEDELTCLEIDHELTKEDGEETWVEEEMNEVYLELASIRNQLTELGVSGRV